MCKPLKGFLLIVPLKATRDSQRFWFWLRSVQFDSGCDAHCRAWLQGMMHTASAVWCTPQSLTLRWDEHRRAWLCTMMHTAEFFREIWVTWLRGVHHTVESDYLENVLFRVFEFMTSFSYLLSKNVWYKKDSLNNFFTFRVIFIVIS